MHIQIEELLEAEGYVASPENIRTFAEAWVKAHPEIPLHMEPGD
jgi:hypothetical protein